MTHLNMYSCHHCVQYPRHFRQNNSLSFFNIDIAHTNRHVHVLVYKPVLLLLSLPQCFIDGAYIPPFRQHTINQHAMTNCFTLNSSFFLLLIYTKQHMHWSKFNSFYFITIEQQFHRLHFSFVSFNTKQHMHWSKFNSFCFITIEQQFHRLNFSFHHDFVPQTMNPSHLAL